MSYWHPLCSPPPRPDVLLTHISVGRGGKSGKSITFFTGENHERALAGELARVLRESGFDHEPLKKFPMTIKKKEHGVYGAFFRDDIPIPKGPTKIKFS